MTSAGSVTTRPRATIHLNAVVANYKTIQAESAGVEVAAVVKANGYGLGAGPVAAALWRAGCRRFFVARLDEGLALRETLPEAEINVFDGLLPGTGWELVEAGLVPILNSLEQLAEWRALCATHGRSLPCGVHLDTGMRRLGLAPDEQQTILADQRLLDGCEVRHVLSHLSCADVPGNTESAEQLQTFTALRKVLGMGTASLANSAGIFLGSEYHFDLVRPGISLYGGTPFPDSGRPNPMRSVVTVEAPIVQVRNATAGETVGYGATHAVTSHARLATIPVGYADGFLRSSSNSGQVCIGGSHAPIVGRISMDLITIDVTGIDEQLLFPGAPVELVGVNCPIDEVAERADSIPHEFLTNLSHRFQRYYEADEGD